MEAEAHDASADSPARRVLLEQLDLIRTQTKLGHWQIALTGDDRLYRRWQIAGERASVVLKTLTGLAGLTVAAALGLMMWDASRYQGVVVEPFSVPPDLAERGITGRVAASKLLDALSAMQAATNSTDRPAGTYASNWGDDIQVAIPETGISLGELRRLLIQWLGDQTVVDGEVYRTPEGLVASARTGGQPAKPHAGPEGDLDALIQAAAEDIYGATQPFRYGIYLQQQGREAEGEAVLRRLSTQGPRIEQGWAYYYLGSVVATRESRRASLLASLRAAELVPEHSFLQYAIGLSHWRLSHPEESLRVVSQVVV